MGESGPAAANVQAARLLDQDDAELDTVAAHLLLSEPTAKEWVIAELRPAARRRSAGASRKPQSAT